MSKNMLRQSMALALLSLSAAALHASDAVNLPDGKLPVQGVVGGTEFPARDRATLRNGAFVTEENLRQMGTGLSKPQVRSLLGNPHFSEGIAGVSTWNYIFNFRTSPDAFVSCQYQVNYVRGDGGYVSDSMHWDGPACLEALNAEPALAPEPAPAPEPVVHTLSADALFAFDRSGISDIQPRGREEVAALAASLREAGTASIAVTGYADRLGNASYNQQLSERRAETVKQLLVQEGVPASSITAFGRGASNPVSTGCGDSMARSALIECLRPDRRVEVEVTTRD